MMFSGMSSLLVMCHPALSRKHHGVCALGDVARDFVDVELHHVGVGIGKRQSRSDALALSRSRRTDRRCRSGADRRVVLVSFRAPGPLADEAVLLADPGFVLEPDFDRRRLGQPCEMSFQRAREVFKPLDDPLVLSRMTRPGADVREAKLLQEFSDIARMKVDAQTFRQ